MFIESIVSVVSFNQENAKPERAVPKSIPTTTATGFLSSSLIFLWDFNWLNNSIFSLAKISFLLMNCEEMKNE